MEEKYQQSIPEIVSFVGEEIQKFVRTSPKIVAACTNLKSSHNLGLSFSLSIEVVESTKLEGDDGQEGDLSFDLSLDDTSFLREIGLDPGSLNGK